VALDPAQLPPVHVQDVAAGEQAAVSVIGVLITPVAGPVTVQVGGPATTQVSVRAPGDPPYAKSLQFWSENVNVAPICAEAGRPSPTATAQTMADSSVRNDDFVI
jgi:hypothetical protein